MPKNKNTPRIRQTQPHALTPTLPIYELDRIQLLQVIIDPPTKPVILLLLRLRIKQHHQLIYRTHRTLLIQYLQNPQAVRGYLRYRKMRNRMDLLHPYLLKIIPILRNDTVNRRPRNQRRNITRNRHLPQRPRNVDQHLITQLNLIMQLLQHDSTRIKHVLLVHQQTLNPHQPLKNTLQTRRNLTNRLMLSNKRTRV